MRQRRNLCLSAFVLATTLAACGDENSLPIFFGNGDVAPDADDSDGSTSEIDGISDDATPDVDDSGDSIDNEIADADSTEGDTETTDITDESGDIDAIDPDSSDADATDADVLPAENCANLIDDDGDGATDCLDSDCVGICGPTCGNGSVELGETCEDGNQAAGDGCDADCQIEPGFINECGDGVLITFAGEACDDGDDNSDVEPDACRTDCTLPACGDGVLDSAEACDTGEDLGAGRCSLDCEVVPVCGDRIVDSPEQCDDGNAAPGDGCFNCLLEAPPRCGDGRVTAGEDCDGAAGTCGSNQFCAADCLCAEYTCGNNSREGTEQCDGSDRSACGANQTCTACACTNYVCGNNTREGTEQCDGTDRSSCGANQSCNSCACIDNVCGNNTREGTEQCDGTDRAACGTGTCVSCACVAAAACGNNVREGAEQCDGTDRGICVASDLCLSCNCASPRCGDGVLSAGEECEDSGDCGTNEACEGCACVAVELCGNGRIDGGESCDGTLGCTSGTTCRNCASCVVGELTLSDGRASRTDDARIAAIYLHGFAPNLDLEALNVDLMSGGNVLAGGDGLLLDGDPVIYDEATGEFTLVYGLGGADAYPTTTSIRVAVVTAGGDVSATLELPYGINPTSGQTCIVSGSNGLNTCASTSVCRVPTPAALLGTCSAARGSAPVLNAFSADPFAGDPADVVFIPNGQSEVCPPGDNPHFISFRARGTSSEPIVRAGIQLEGIDTVARTIGVSVSPLTSAFDARIEACLAPFPEGIDVSFTVIDTVGRSSNAVVASFPTLTTPTLTSMVAFRGRAEGSAGIGFSGRAPSLNLQHILLDGYVGAANSLPDQVTAIEPWNWTFGADGSFSAGAPFFWDSTTLSLTRIDGNLVSWANVLSATRSAALNAALPGSGGACLPASLGLVPTCSTGLACHGTTGLAGTCGTGLGVAPVLASYPADPFNSVPVLAILENNSASCTNPTFPNLMYWTMIGTTTEPIVAFEIQSTSFGVDFFPFDVDAVADREFEFAGGFCFSGTLDDLTVRVVDEADRVSNSVRLF